MPTPTDATVRLVVEPPWMVAVRRFSWYATDERVRRERERLSEEFTRRGLETDGEPALLQYNDPWTPPFMRTNEIEVPVADVPDDRHSGHSQTVARE
ncbi:SOUL heme-binding protein [Natrinema pellirubrum DSM 15624]|uniref:SOUL heme-binding protein n=1 Tax=Natrinema pellirubrum (strain DSM 15624 / CIP 106293 / JCM 10476 / NCIMB 786 / 157) TaxID=797303 RepID=L9YI07_NATP1|nr:SOUL heme-binding protein [Natrinema pellirubrum DSM 15624]